MKQYSVDAFTGEVFHGNQAAVCVPEHALTETLMQNIARENNYSETAFAVRRADGYDLRWFTPGGEINLCGHATLGTAYVLFRFYEPEAERLTFHTQSGDLYVTREGEALVMDFPAYACNKIPVTDEMAAVMGARPRAAYIDRDLLLVYDDEQTVRTLAPDFARMAALPGLGVGVTAPGRDYDCVSRFFAPKLGVDEDPVTGSVHCMIAPYWCRRLGKSSLRAYQASSRGGELRCKSKKGRVLLAGRAALYAISELYV